MFGEIAKTLYTKLAEKLKEKDESPDDFRLFHPCGADFFVKNKVVISYRGNDFCAVGLLALKNQLGVMGNNTL